MEIGLVTTQVKKKESKIYYNISINSRNTEKDPLAVCWIVLLKVKDLYLMQ